MFSSVPINVVNTSFWRRIRDKDLSWETKVLLLLFVCLLEKENLLKQQMLSTNRIGKLAIYYHLLIKLRAYVKEQTQKQTRKKEQHM